VRILVFGGTRFVGRAVVEQLLARGHELTLLNRGQSAPDLFPGVARLTLDRRDVTRETLGSGSWDVVVDMNAYFPREIEAAVAALRGRVRRYVMCSTGSVYTGLESYPISEDAPLYACTPEQAEDPGMETYGARKAECERRLRALAAEAGIECFIGRPVVVYGPHDYTDRLHFWLEAVRRGRVVLPEEGLTIFHTIYAGDLARLFTAMAETGPEHAGVYNVGATELHTLGELVEMMASIVGTQPEIASASSALLQRLDIKPQFDLPLWIAGRHVIMEVARAQERLGFRSTPLADTLRATLEAYLAAPRVPLDTVMDPDMLWEQVQAQGVADASPSEV
jgi:2'-hydroxyisoflavone reductase